MPRTTQEQISPRADVQDSLGQMATQLPRGATSLDVAAAPMNQVAGTSGIDNQVSQLASNMSAFTGNFDHLAQAKDKEVVKNEQEKAVLDSINNVGTPVLTSEQSSWYQETRMQMYGKQLGAQSIMDLSDHMASIKNDPEKLRNLDPQGEMKAWFHKNLAGITDPTVAKEVYPMLQQHMVSGVHELNNEKAGQLKKDLVEQHAATVATATEMSTRMMDNGPVVVGEQPPPSKWTPENIQANWATTLNAVGGNEAQAADIIIKSAEQSVTMGRDPSAARALANFRLPSGLTIGMIADKKGLKVHERIDALVKSADALQEKALDQQKSDIAKRQADDTANNIGTASMYIRAGQPLPISGPGSFTSFEPRDQAHLQSEMITVGSKDLRAKDIATKQATVGFNGLQGATPEEKQKVFDAPNFAALQAVSGLPVSDGRVLQTYAGILDRHLDKNSGAKLNGLTEVADGIVHDIPPGDNKGVVGAATLQSQALFQLAKTNPAYSSYLHDSSLFSKEALQRNELISEGVSQGKGMAGAVQYAVNMTTPENMKLRDHWVAKNHDEITSKVISELSPYLGRSLGDQGKDIVAQYLPGFLETAALSKRDAAGLAKDFASKYVPENTVSIPDPQATGWHVVNPNRLFPRVTAEMVGASGFRPEEWSRQVQFYEKQVLPALKAQYDSQDSGKKFALVPDFNNPRQLMVSMDGVVQAQIPPVRAKEIFSFYDKFAGPTPFFGSQSVKAMSEDAARATVKASVIKQFGEVQEGTKGTQGVNTNPVAVVPPKSEDKHAIAASIPLPGFIDAPTYDRGAPRKNSKLQSYAPSGPLEEMLKGAPPGASAFIPPATMAGGVLIPPIPAGMKGSLPPLVPPGS